MTQDYTDYQAAARNNAAIAKANVFQKPAKM
jgi:hypothetical protein